MAELRTRKNKENPHYNFLYSWAPGEPHVKRESKNANVSFKANLSPSKKADIQAKDESSVRIKKDIIRSLILISFVLALEVVIYLAWNKIFLMH